VKEGGDHAGPEEAKETERLKELVQKGLEELELSVRALNSLHGEGIKTIGDLASKTDEDLLKLKNFGRKSLEEIKAALASAGLSLGMDMSAFQKVEQI
jgi:DNA-directed RNA polymerase subunit alpha